MMKKVLKWISIIFQSIGIGAIGLYIYAYIKYKNQWESLSAVMRSNINLYLLIGVVGILSYIITTILIYFTKDKKNSNEVEFEDFSTTGNHYHIHEPKVEESNATGNYYNISEPKVEEKITIVKENKYEVPIERQSICPNCNNVVDKDAFICLHCGILLKKMDVQSPVTEKVVYKEIVVPKTVNDNKYNSVKTIILLIAIIIGLFLAIDFTREQNSIFNNSLIKNETEMKKNFYELANSTVKDVLDRYKKGDITVNHDKTYFTISDLGYRSYEYDTNKSYIAIDKSTKKMYIALSGINNYAVYSIDITEVNNLDESDVLVNTSIVNDIDGKLLINGGNSVIVYTKN